MCPRAREEAIIYRSGNFNMKRIAALFQWTATTKNYKNKIKQNIYIRYFVMYFILIYLYELELDECNVRVYCIICNHHHVYLISFEIDMEFVFSSYFSYKLKTTARTNCNHALIFVFVFYLSNEIFHCDWSHCLGIPIRMIFTEIGSLA